MLPYRGKVLVKVKKWHKGGGLVAPFVEARVLCPSHLVNGGWVVQLQDGRVLHVREAAQTNQEGEQLRIQQGVQGDMVQLEEDDRLAIDLLVLALSLESPSMRISAIDWPITCTSHHQVAW